MRIFSCFHRLVAVITMSKQSGCGVIFNSKISLSYSNWIANSRILNGKFISRMFLGNIICENSTSSIIHKCKHLSRLHPPRICKSNYLKSDANHQIRMSFTASSCSLGPIHIFKTSSCFNWHISLAKSWAAKHGPSFFQIINSPIFRQPAMRLATSEEHKIR